jgi:hypothetical protein
MTRPSPDIEVHIAELVLHGFAPGDRRGVADALEAELGRLLAARGLALPAADIAVARIAADPIDPAAGGRAIAGAIHGALDRLTTGGGR